MNNDKNNYPATVVGVRDGGYKVVIDRGSKHGVKKGDKFLIYIIEEEELIHPETEESLGHLEKVKGEGRVIHVQKEMSTIETTGTKTSRKSYTSPLFPMGGREQSTETIKVPFKDPQVGDKVKPI